MSIAEQLLSNDPASQMLGIKISEIGSGRCKLIMFVTDKMTNGYDLCHGGFLFTLADTACAFACAKDNERVLSVSSQIEYIAPAHNKDKLIATANVSHTNGKYIYCDVEIHNQNKQMIALLRGKTVRKKNTPLSE